MLLPPKPNEFDTAIADRVRPGFVGDQAEVDVGVVEIDRGRDRLVPHRGQTGQGLERAGGGEHVAGQALGRGDGNAIGVVAQDEAEDRGLGRVADRRAGGMGVDVVDLAGLDPRVGQGLAHGGGGRGRVGAGNHVVVGVAAGPAAGDLGVGMRAATAGVAGPLEDERHSSLTEHEAVSAAVEWTRRGGRIAVPSRQRPKVAERRQADRRDGQVAGPGHADVHQTKPKPVAADLQRVVAAGARRRKRQRRAQ